MRLECSSRGDKRYSAFSAIVEVYRVRKPLEFHYQLSKRFGDYKPRTWRDAKGKKPTHFEVGGVKFPLELLSAWYDLLWVKYLDEHPELVEHAKQFDEFIDCFAKPGTNNQAKTIEQYVKHGRESIIYRDDVVVFLKILKEKG